MKFKQRTDQTTGAARKLARRPVLLALTAACVMAHAAVLAGLPRPRAAPGLEVAQHGVMHLTSVNMTMPSTLRHNPVEPRVTAPDAATPTETPRKIGSARNEPARPTTPAAVPSAPPPVFAAARLSPADASVEHLPTSALDVPPMPRSAPDEQYVEYVHRSGLPIQLRLYIDAAGTVTDANLLGAAPGDQEAAEQVIAMFRDTAFMPGRRQGREVPSFIDIELVLEPQLPAVGRIFQQ